MIFDTWGGALADGAYQRFSLDYMRQVVRGLKTEKDGVRIPSIVFTKGGGLWLEQIADIGADAVGLDWTVNLAQARARVADRVALQGNLDPVILFSAPGQIRAEVARVLESFGPPGRRAGHVFNLGHGISQFTPPEAVAVMVETVHEVSRRIRAGA
jgi:uroporphyrinogen decarboxylase